MIAGALRSWPVRRAVRLAFGVLDRIDAATVCLWANVTHSGDTPAK